MTRVSPDFLHAFIACVDCGGFSNAAKKLRKSQATISVFVANLEEDLNLTLFDRSGRLPKLTKDGEVIYSYARNVVLAQQELMNIAGTLLDTREASIAIALSDYIPAAQREKMKELFESRMKGIRITILTAESYDVVQGLSSGEFDVAVVPAIKARINYPVELTGRRAWFTSPLHLYCANEHPLSKIVDPTEHHLKSQRRIRLLRGTINNDSPRDDIYTDNIFCAYRLCAQGLGWCELPEWVVENQQMLGDNRLKKISIPPSRRVLEFDVVYRNEAKGKFLNWFIRAVTNKKYAVLNDPGI